jgi:hypothetical protein
MNNEHTEHQPHHQEHKLKAISPLALPRKPEHVEHQEQTSAPAPLRDGQVVSVGRIVHYVLSSGANKGQHRPAIVVRVWGEATTEHTPTCQLQVFTDATNDFVTGPGSNGILWATSATQDPTGERLGSWHWPEKVGA